MLERNTWMTGILLLSLIAISPSGKANEQSTTDSVRPAATDNAHHVVAEATNEAAEKAAEQAIQSLRDETRLELDIRLLSPMSVGQANDS